MAADFITTINMLKAASGKAALCEAIKQGYILCSKPVTEGVFGNIKNKLFGGKPNASSSNNTDELEQYYQQPTNGQQEQSTGPRKCKITYGQRNGAVYFKLTDKNIVPGSVYEYLGSENSSSLANAQFKSVKFAELPQVGKPLVAYFTDDPERAAFSENLWKRWSSGAPVTKVEFG